MPRTRLLVVDDSVVVRKLLSDILAEESSFEVVGTAANGSIALKKIPQLHPDLVVLDVEMPVMDGLETLKEIKREDPDLRVVMFSSFTTTGAQVTVDALTLGAEDYVAKPSNLMDSGEARAAIAEELIGKIKAIAQPGRALRTAQETPPVAIVAPAGSRPRVDVPCKQK